MRTLYPDIEPFDTGTLKVDERHTLYYEQCGNPQGKPVVLLHGGPGAGCGAAQPGRPGDARSPRSSRRR